MLLYDYVCKGTKNEHLKFSLKDLGISLNDKIPQTFKKDGKTWIRILDTTSLFKAEEGEEKILVNSIEYFLQMGEKPLSEVWVNNKKFIYEKTVEGIPNFADFSDTFRQMHDDSYHVKFTKPPLECESSTWGYGLT